MGRKTRKRKNRPPPQRTPSSSPAPPESLPPESLPPESLPPESLPPESPGLESPGPGPASTAKQSRTAARPRGDWKSARFYLSIGISLGATLALVIYFVSPPESGENERQIRQISRPSTLLPRMAVAAPLAPPGHVEIEEIAWPSVTGDAQRELRSAMRELQQARGAFERGDPATGEQALLQGLERLTRARILPEDLRGYFFQVTAAALDTGRLAEALQRSRLWMTAFPDDLNALNAAMVAASRHGQQELAARAARKLLESRPSDSAAREALAISLFRRNRWIESAKVARDLCAQRPDDRQAWRLLSESCRETGQKDLGVRAARRLLELIKFPARAASEPEHEKPLLSAMKTLHRFKEFELLLPVAAFYRKWHPESAIAAMSEGVSRFETGDASGAEPLLRKALADPTNSDDVRFTLGLALAKQRNFDEAAREFSILLAENPFFERAYYQLGQQQARLGNLDLSQAYMKRSRELAASARDLSRYRSHRAAGNLPLAAESRARGHLARGQFARAEEALLDKALQRNPRTNRNLCRFYIESLRTQEAERQLVTLSELIGRTHHDVSGLRSELDWLLGRHEASMVALRALVSRSDCSREWKRLLARRLIEMKKPADAVTVLAPLRINAGDRMESYLMGQAYLASEDAAKALEMFTSISSGDTRWEDWNMDLWMARSLARAGRVTEAKTSLARASADARKTPSGREAEIDVLEASEDLDTAAEGRLRTAKVAVQKARDLRPALDELQLKICRTSWPAQGSLHLRLAEKLEEIGERVKAVRHARLALQANPGSASVLEKLVDWTDRVGDAFLRLQYLRRLVRQQPADEQTVHRLRELERQLIR